MGCTWSQSIQNVSIDDYKTEVNYWFSAFFSLTTQTAVRPVDDLHSDQLTCCPVRVFGVQMDNQIVVSDYAQMDRVLREERAYILNMVKQIKKAGCNVLLIQKSILRYALPSLPVGLLNVALSAFRPNGNPFLPTETR